MVETISKAVENLTESELESRVLVDPVKKKMQSYELEIVGSE